MPLDGEVDPAGVYFGFGLFCLSDNLFAVDVSIFQAVLSCEAGSN